MVLDVRSLGVRGWGQLFCPWVVIEHGILRECCSFLKCSQEILMKPEYHGKLSSRIFSKRPLKTSFLLRRRGQLHRKSNITHGKRPHSTPTTPWHQYGDRFHLHVQCRGLNTNVVLFRVETHTTHSPLGDADHSCSRIFPNSL